MSACQKYMSFPCLVTAGRGTRRPPCKEMGRTKILVNRGAKEVECETLCPLRSEADFPENPMRSVLHQEREAESWKLESVHKEAGFLFSQLHCKLNVGNIKYFMPWQKLVFPYGKEKKGRIPQKTFKMERMFQGFVSQRPNVLKPERECFWTWLFCQQQLCLSRKQKPSQLLCTFISQQNVFIHLLSRPCNSLQLSCFILLFPAFIILVHKQFCKMDLQKCFFGRELLSGL